MFVKITSVTALPDYVLLVGFSTGEFKQFDLKPLINKYPPFKSLVEVEGLYGQVKIDVGGYGLVWQKLVEEFVKARKSMGLSQKQLEILSGVPQACIARTEKGITDPQLNTLLRLLEPLGLTLSITNI